MNLEKSILGTLLVFPESISDVVRILKPAEFKTEGYKDIVSFMVEMFEANKAMDLVIISNAVKARGIKVTTHDLTMLTSDIVTDANLIQYCYLLKEKRLLDKITSIAVKIEHGTKNRTGLEEMLDTLTSELQDIQEEVNAARPRPEHIREHMNQMIDSYFQHEKMLSSGKDHLIKTPLVDLNKIIAGWIPGDLIIVAARPSMGKTAFVLNSALKAAETKHVVFFSLEMSATQLCIRAASKVMDVDAYKIRDGRLNSDEKNKLEALVNVTSQLNMIIDDTPGPSMSYIYATAKMHALRSRCDMVIIDYLGMINMSQGRGESRDQAVGKVTRLCKVMARELGVPVILVSQLNRDVEKRGRNKRPLLSDLRESGNIEQDADIVLFMYRDYYYNKSEDSKGYGEAIVAKHRNGALGTAYFKHNESMTEFYDTQEVPAYEETSLEF